MGSIFTIKNLFKLYGNTTVIACEAQDDFPIVAGCIGMLMHDGNPRQKVIISGERKMLNQNSHTSVRAFETLGDVQLSIEEATSGAWTLSFNG